MWQYSFHAYLLWTQPNYCESKWLTRLWFDFEHDNFTPCTSLQQAESLTKCPLTLENARITPSFTCCCQINYSLYAEGE